MEAFGPCGSIGAHAGVVFNTGGAGNISGNIVIMGVTINTPAGQPVTYSYNFKGDGAVN